MSRFAFPLAFALALGGVAAVPAPPAVAQAPAARADDELVEKVRKAIDAGVRYLKKQQSPQGNWEGIVIGFLADMEGGSTALVTLSLLNCGLKPDDPAVARAIDYLHKLPPKKTYVVALCNMVLAETRDKKYLPAVQKNADWLIKNGIGWGATDDGKMTRVSGKLEGWSYPQNQLADNSNTQYALLGLYAAKQAGAAIHDEVWKAIQDYYTRHQHPGVGNTGYWTYYNDRNLERPSISMTVAGVCGLYIARMGLDESQQELDPATGVAAQCGVYGENTPLAKGMNWVAENFSFESPKSTFYNIYGIERLGRLSGQRFVGKHDWYREGCVKLVEILQKSSDGSFSGGRQVDGTAHLSTAFALLFLSKGRTPVLVSKFAWGDFQVRGDVTVEVPHPDHRPPAGATNWNRKHNDTRHVVEFCSKELFDNAPLSWQVYDARRRKFDSEAGAGGKSTDEKIREEVGELLQSPVLYLTGHGPLALTDDQKAILKLYLDEGGFIVGEACCGDPVFAKSFRSVIGGLFEDKKTGTPGATFRPLSPEHAIWKMLPGVLPTDFPELEGLERGCRTIAVFSPKPLAGYWEEAKYMPKDPRNPANRGEKAFCLIRNVVAYATGMELPKPKLSRTNIVAKGAETGVTRSHFRAVQLSLPGEQQPAPDALKNLMGYLRERAKLEVALTSAVLPPYDDQVFNFKFMYLHGRKPLDLKEADLEMMQANLQSGGLLLADAACGGYAQWKEFDKSFRDLCKKLFPKQDLVVIRDERGPDGKEEPFFKIARDAGIDLKNLRCRRELPDDKGPEREMRDYPVLLEGIKIDGRWAVIYSKYDIGCALEGHKAADCLGYDKESALRIGSAVVLYSLKR